MRIAIIGQKDFGKAVLEAFVKRGDTVAGVFCATEKATELNDPLRLAAEEAGINIFQLTSFQTTTARETLSRLELDLGVMAYVLSFVPQNVINIPRYGMIQYHPSLLPRHRGPSSIHWPIILGEKITGLTIFRPTDGLDEGPIVLQRCTTIAPDDTLGNVYFDRLLPMGVAALLEAADLVLSGRAPNHVQDESSASYESWCKAPEAHINWHNHVDQVYNLIRGCNPVPGAWTLFKGRRLQLFESRRHPTRSFAQAHREVGSVTKVAGQSMFVMAQGGEIEVLKVRYDGGEKVSASWLCASAGIAPETLLGE
jgi:methionyl-tRNA formyltransferase